MFALGRKKAAIRVAFSLLTYVNFYGHNGRANRGQRSTQNIALGPANETPIKSVFVEGANYPFDGFLRRCLMGLPTISFQDTFLPDSF